VDDTQEILEQSLEALVLGYHFEGPEARFDLVCERRQRAEGGDRAFIEFVFRGVECFERELGESARLRRVGTTFVSRDVEGAWVIQAVHLARIRSLKIVSIFMGQSFGSVEFRYESVSHRTINLYAQARGENAWDYFEVGTHRPVDFYNPFGSTWAA
jgi:hypothetical protein